MKPLSCSNQMDVSALNLAYAKIEYLTHIIPKEVGYEYIDKVHSTSFEACELIKAFLDRQMRYVSIVPKECSIVSISRRCCQQGTRGCVVDHDTEVDDRKFREWLNELDKIARIAGFGNYIASTGEESWKTYFESDLSPADAFMEDMSNAD